MFAHGRNIRANPAEGLRSCDRPETAGNLLLDFHHAQVAFGQVVIKGDTEVSHKAQDFRLALLLQAQEQVARLALFAAPALAGYGGGGRVLRQACRQQGLRAGEKRFVRRRVQAFCPGCLRRLDGAFDCAQEVLQGLRPGLPACSTSAVSSRK